jgi:mannose/fructose/N-acetylgalactosamine-specific phosphotransferase system component IIB
MSRIIFYLILKRIIIVEEEVVETCTREHTMKTIAPQKLQVSYLS